MKFQIPLLLLAFLGISSLFAQSTSTHQMLFPITTTWEDGNGALMAQISLPESVEWGTSDQAKIIDLWQEDDPKVKEALGTAQLDATDIPTLNFRLETAGSVLVGDLLQGSVSIPSLPERSIFFDMVSQQVWLTDVYEVPFYSAEEILQEDGPELEEELIQRMIEDIRFVGKAMQDQEMEDVPIEKGPYEGPSIFEEMKRANEQQLIDFLSFVRYKPMKYRGHSWKVSEVFATWLVAGAPTEAEMMVEDIFAEINTVRNSDGGPDCDGEELVVDLKTGLMNGFSPAESMDAIKERFPCFTGESKEGMTGNCGGGVFYLKHDFFFYSHRDYLEVRDNFRGTVSIDLFGKSLAEVKAILGKPKHIPEYVKSEDDWFEYTPDIHHLYKRKYGTLRVTFDPETKRVSEIGIHHQKWDEIEICW